MEISKCLGGSKLEEDEEQAHKRTKRRVLPSVSIVLSIDMN